MTEIDYNQSSVATLVSSLKNNNNYKKIKMSLAAVVMGTLQVNHTSSLYLAEHFTLFFFLVFANINPCLGE